MQMPCGRKGMRACRDKKKTDEAEGQTARDIQ